MGSPWDWKQERFLQTWVLLARRGGVMENGEAGCASGSDKRPDKRKKVGGEGKGEWPCSRKHL